MTSLLTFSSLVSHPGTGAPIEMFFLNPGGSKTGKLFPTGLRKEPLLIPNYDPIEVTIIDCANPVVLLAPRIWAWRGQN